MKKRGFTLIELLAVIVVLAIIALIATPIVMNTIEKSKKGAAERTADNYIDAVETTVATKRLDGDILEGTYTINDKGNLEGNGLTEPLIIEMNGNKPTSGTIKISNGQVTTDSKMTVGSYEVAYNPTAKKYEATKVETYKITYNLTNVSGDNVTSITSVEAKSLTFIANTGYSLPESVTVSGATYTWDKATGALVLLRATGDVTVTINGVKTYTNGEVIYFNVTTGEKCLSSDYTETQSNTGTKSGCMKFYAFNDDGKDTVNLILDHNTTATVAWNNTYTNNSGSKINAKGPKEVLDQLKTDTSSWKGTITSSNYTMNQSTQGSKAKYTIDYSEYKARLITAQEIAQITGNTGWNEKTANNKYYLDSKTTTASATCKNGNTSGCKFGWLYDRTSKNCTTHGCLNNSDVTTYGYWTASSRADYSRSAWLVIYDARVDSSNVGNSDDYGVRPVITILKSKLS